MKLFARITATMLAVLTIICGAINLPAAQAAEAEMRGVWVSTVYNLDYPNNQTTEPDALRAQADRIIANCKSMGMNTIFLQVRPSSDAFYNSEIFPWSKYLTGAQGTAPADGFDPLEYWVEKTHENGMELHAWINPFRVAMSDSDYNSIVSSHIAKVNADWVVKHTNGQYYLNPGISEVRELVLKGAREIVDNYDVDGLHLDDYFYPAASFDDGDTYAAYGKDYGNIEDWRRSNINSLVSSLKDLAEQCGITFGVSVGGIWANASDVEGGSETGGNQTYSAHFADSREWVRQGWVDYICPQIYWNIGHSLADYETLVNWWAQIVNGTGVKLFIGMADYQAGNSNPESAWYGIEEIKRQIELNRGIPEVTGEIHFRYKFLAENSELFNYYNNIYSGSTYEVEEEKPISTHKAYMQGAGNKFKPDGKLTRAEAAILFARLMTDKEGNPMFDESVTYAASFEDVSEDAWYANVVGFMEKYKVLAGYPDGTFLPEKTITRAEFSAVVARFEKETTSENVTTGFEDVPETHWASGYVASAVKKGYISGYGDGSFKPENQITRAETVKITNRMLGRSPDKEYIDKKPGINAFTDLTSKHWAYYQIIEASYEHAYSWEGDNEMWNDGGNAPSIPFISDTFEFLQPKLITTEPLEPLDLTKIQCIALHHMAHPTADFRTVEQWHLDQGWRAFGYNFFIDFEGNVYVGRGWNVAAGVANKNSVIISIGFQGDYESTNKKMPAAQYNAGVELIKWISWRVPSIKEVGGHRDYGATLCPGEYFPLDKMKSAAGF